MNKAEAGFQRSLWRATARQGVPQQGLEQNLDCDVVIVGGGITGLSAALHLQEAGRQVVLLEAQEVGWGASGRNGAQVNPGWYLMPSQIRALYGRERGQRVLRFIDGACDEVFKLIERYRIDCAARRAPFFRAAWGRRGLREVEQWTREWGELGAPVTLYNRRQTQELLGSSLFDGGLADARGGSLHPLNYVRGLEHAAIAHGALIYTQSPVLTIEDYVGGWSVTTRQGARVDAPYLILATNGYTDSLWPGLKRQVVPVVSRQTATRPLPGRLLKSILPQGHHVADTRYSPVYFRVDESGRFQIGGRGNPFSSNSQFGNTRHLRREAIRIFPQLAGVEWEFNWGGLVAITETRAPQLIELAAQAYAGLGYNGRGVAMGTLMGQQLAQLVDDENTAMPLQRLSPIRFHAWRNLGVAWHMYSGKLHDALDRFRRPD